MSRLHPRLRALAGPVIAFDPTSNVRGSGIDPATWSYLQQLAGGVDVYTGVCVRTSPAWRRPEGAAMRAELEIHGYARRDGGVPGTVRWARWVPCETCGGDGTLEADFAGDEPPDCPECNGQAGRWQRAWEDGCR